MKGKIFYVFESEYPEEGVVSIVRCRSGEQACLQVARADQSQGAALRPLLPRSPNLMPLGPPPLMAFRISELRAARAEGRHPEAAFTFGDVDYIRHGLMPGYPNFRRPRA